jgi:hypothetical protein
MANAGKMIKFKIKKMERDMKRYIKVKAFFNTDGTVMPIAIMVNERNYKVSQVISVKPEKSYMRGVLLWRYHCVIEGQEKFLYYEFAFPEKLFFWYAELTSKEMQQYV